MSTYNEKQIGWELERTALGDGYYGDALRVAKDMPGISDLDCSLLDRWATGAQQSMDHVRLQEFALKVYQSGCAEADLPNDDPSPA